MKISPIPPSPIPGGKGEIFTVKNRRMGIGLGAAILFCAILLPVTDIHAGDIDCSSCHGYRTMASFDKGVSRSLYIDLDLFKSSSHGKAACAECHEDYKEVPHKKALKKVDCTRECHISENGQEKLYSHKEAAEAVALSVHSKSGKDGKIKTDSGLIPDCIGCHPFDHSGKSAGLKGDKLHKVMSKEQVIKVCGGCHSGPDVVSRFRLSDVLASYKESFHGKQFSFGKGDMPDCIDCHADPAKGAHIIMGRDDKGKASDRCKSADCHKSAGEGLKGFHVHVSYDRKNYPVEYYARLIFRTLAALVVFSLLGVAFLELLRRLFPEFTLFRNKER